MDRDNLDKELERLQNLLKEKHQQRELLELPHRKYGIDTAINASKKLKEVKEEIQNIEHEIEKLNDKKDQQEKYNSSDNQSVTIVNSVSDQAYATSLRNFLMDHFNENELRALCADLGIDYENLSGSGKAAKTLDLVEYAKRHGIIKKLVKTAQDLRPLAKLKIPGGYSLLEESSTLKPLKEPSISSEYVWTGWIFATIAILYITIIGISGYIIVTADYLQNINQIAGACQTSDPVRKITPPETFIPAGPFLQGSIPEQIAYFEQLCFDVNRKAPVQGKCSKDFFNDEKNQRRVDLSAFYIDTLEVSNEQFQQFVNDTGYTTTAELSGTSLVWAETINDFKEEKDVNWCHPGGIGTSIIGFEKYPVVHVAHKDAKAYCEWIGRRLPTESEWEKAARGEDGLLFPWGNVWDADRVRHAKDGLIMGPVTIDSYLQGASPYGVQNMLGNVSEWVNDWYDNNYYEYARVNNLNINPKGPVSPPDPMKPQHSRRGGGWATRSGYLHAAWRIDRPDDTSNVVGFRCARNP